MLLKLCPVQDGSSRPGSGSPISDLFYLACPLQARVEALRAQSKKQVRAQPVSSQLVLLTRLCSLPRKHAVHAEQPTTCTGCNSDVAVSNPHAVNASDPHAVKWLQQQQLLRVLQVATFMAEAAAHGLVPEQAQRPQHAGSSVQHTPVPQHEVPMAGPMEAEGEPWDFTTCLTADNRPSWERCCGPRWLPVPPGMCTALLEHVPNVCCSLVRDSEHGSGITALTLSAALSRMRPAGRLCGLQPRLHLLCQRRRRDMSPCQGALRHALMLGRKCHLSCEHTPSLTMGSVWLRAMLPVQPAHPVVCRLRITAVRVSAALLAVDLHSGLPAGRTDSLQHKRGI